MQSYVKRQHLKKVRNRAQTQDSILWFLKSVAYIFEISNFSNKFLVSNVKTPGLN